MFGALGSAGRAASLGALLIGCASAPPARTPANAAPADDLCPLLDQVVEAARDDFTSLERTHDRTSGPFTTTVKPGDAREAVLRPCCTAGAWMWAASWPDAYEVTELRRRVLSCPIASRMAPLGSDGLAWQVDQVIVEVSAVVTGVELAVGRDR